MMFGYFAGFLAADPEERMTSKGNRVVTFRIGVKTRNGAKEETVWCTCNLWHNRYDRMLPYLKKGSAVIVAGDISIDCYSSRDGSPRASLIVSVDSLKFSPFGKPSGKGSFGEPSGEENISLGFDGENLDSSSLDKEVFTGYESEEIPF